MKKPWLLAAFWATVLLVSMSAQGAEKTDDLIREAAFQDGMNKLMGEIARQKVTDSVTVDDFLGSAPGLREFLFGLVRDRVTRIERRFHDGAREADLHISLADLSSLLKLCIQKDRFVRLAQRWPAAAFNQLLSFSQTPDLRVTGASHNIVNARSIVRPPSPLPRIWDEQIKGPGRLMARSAAEKNAIENLYQAVTDLPIGRAGRLREFLAPSGRARRELRAFLADHARVVKGTIRYIEDATCEVDVEISASAFLAKLEGLVKSRIDSRLSRFAGYPLDKLVNTGGRKIFRATGLGFPPDEYLRIHSAAGHRPSWAREKMSAQGRGFPPDEVESFEEARALGFARALDEAVGRILLQVRGLGLLSKKTVGDLLTPVRKRALVEILKQGRIRDIGFEGKSGYRIELEVNLWKVWNLVMGWR